MYAQAAGDIKMCGLWIVPSIVGLYGKDLLLEVPIMIGFWRDAKQGWVLGFPWKSGLTS